MKKTLLPSTIINRSILTIFLCLAIQFSQAQIEKDSPIFIELLKRDSLIFEEGFNKCNFEALERVLHKDLEFLHDVNGRQDLDTFLTTFSESICSNKDYKPIRKLLDETLEVFVLKNEGIVYGAIQTGAHVFYIKEPNKELYATQKAKFINTWVLENGNWLVKTILSYEHRPPDIEYGPRFDAGYTPKLFDNDQKIEELLIKHNIPSVSIGYIKDGKVQQVRSFGNQEDGKPVSTQTIYKVASLTKPVVALVTLKLIEAGEWDLDQPVSKYFIDEDIAESPYLNKLTTRHILSHQSGFLNWRYLSDDNKLVFEFEPGTKWQYSGEGFEYLRKAIEKKLGQPFEEIAQEKLFVPLDMNSTYFNWNENFDEELYAVEHDKKGLPLAYRKHTETNAAANLMTTAEDYSKFLVHISLGAGLSTDLYTEFLTAQAHQKEGIDYGLGMQLLTNLPNNDLGLMHTGGDDGIKAIAILLNNSKQGIVILSNSENGMVLWQKIIAEYFGETGIEIVKRNLTE